MEWGVKQLALTPKDADQYRDLIEEIKDLQAEIKSFTTVPNTVNGSQPEHPFTFIPNMPVQCYGSDQTLMLLEIRLHKAVRLRHEIEEFINSFPNDSKSRRILDYRIKKGMNWVQISVKMGMSVESLEQRYSRMFKKQKKK